MAVENIYRSHKCPVVSVIVNMGDAPQGTSDAEVDAVAEAMLVEAGINPEDFYLDDSQRSS